MHHHTANPCILWLGATSPKKVNTFTSIKLQSDLLSPEGKSRVLLLRHRISCGLCCYSLVGSPHSQNALIASPCGLHLAGMQKLNFPFIHTDSSPFHFHISSQKLSRTLWHINFSLQQKLLKPFLFCFSSRTSTSGNIILTLLIITKCTQKASDNKVKFLFLALEKFLSLPYFIMEPCFPCLWRKVCCWIFSK